MNRSQVKKSLDFSQIIFKDYSAFRDLLRERTREVEAGETICINKQTHSLIYRDSLLSCPHINFDNSWEYEFNPLGSVAKVFTQDRECKKTGYNVIVCEDPSYKDSMIGYSSSDTTGALMLLEKYEDLTTKPLAQKPEDLAREFEEYLRVNTALKNTIASLLTLMECSKKDNS